MAKTAEELREQLRKLRATTNLSLSGGSIRDHRPEKPLCLKVGEIPDAGKAVEKFPARDDVDAAQTNLPVPVPAEPNNAQKVVGEAREGTENRSGIRPEKAIKNLDSQRRANNLSGPKGGTSVHTPPAVMNRPAQNTYPQGEIPEKRAGALPSGRQRQLPAHLHSTWNILPHSDIAERGVLSAMIKAARATIPIVQQAIDADYFCDPIARELFTELCAFCHDEGEFNLPTFTQHLIDVGRLDKLGGPGYLTALGADFFAGPENVTYYLDILKDKYALRRIIKAGTEAAQAAQALQDGGNAADIFDDLFTSLEAARGCLTSSLRLPALCDISRFLGSNQPALPNELVKGIVHQGSKLVVGGTSKGRKTMALIDLAVSVATGSSWWGFPCIQGPVCYINFEIQDPFFAHRTHVVCEAKKVGLPHDQFMVWNLRGHGEGLENLTHDLMAVLRHKHFVLIIFDPIYKGLGSRDENKAGDVASMMNELEKIAVKTRAAVAFGAHYSKGNQALKESVDRIGGSGVFARDPDSILTMTAHEEPEAFTVDATLRNFAPLAPFVVQFEWPLFRQMVDADPEQLKPARTSSNEGKYKATYSADMLIDEMSVIHGIKAVQLRKIMDERHGMQKSAFYRFLAELHKKGLITECDGELLKTSKQVPQQ
jgi:hypothetical protein